MSVNTFVCQWCKKVILASEIHQCKKAPKYNLARMTPSPKRRISK